MKLYDNIKYYRKKNGLTQTELALKMGYTDKSMISQIERGKIDLPLSKVEAFANIFGVSPSILMGWDNDYQIDDMTAAFNSLADTDREYIKRTIELMQGGRK